MKLALGVWCGAGSGVLLQRVKELPIILITMKRAQRVIQPVALVPWDQPRGLLEEILSWKLKAVPCHPDERIAMRDLVVSTGADVGVVVDGACALIDKEEILLAAARAEAGIEVKSLRLKARRRLDWLTVSDSDEWPPYWQLEDISKLSFGQDPITFNARQAWMKAQSANSDVGLNSRCPTTPKA